MNTQAGASYADAVNGFTASIKRELVRVRGGQSNNLSLNNIYHVADANLRYFFPRMDKADREGVLDDVFIQQRMAFYDEGQFDLIDSTRLDDKAGILSSARAGQAHIFCTYHVSSYRHLFHFLAAAGFDCLLFMATRSLESQGANFLLNAQVGAAARGWTGTMATLDAQNRNSLLYGTRALKRGTSIIIYIDGNAGVGANSDNDRLLPVDFFGRQILARTGIGYLSHLSHVPIVPVVCTRSDSSALTMTLHEPIMPGSAAREAYAKAATVALYALLEREIAARPGLWEGWLFIEKSLKREAENAPQLVDRPVTVTPDMTLQADVERFALLQYATQAVLLDKRTHGCVMLDEATAATFRSAAGGGPTSAALLAGAGPLRLYQLGALQLVPTL
jgi:lauroyl/myristoyl acyltransferase